MVLGGIQFRVWLLSTSIPTNHAWRYLRGKVTCVPVAMSQELHVLDAETREAPQTDREEREDLDQTDKE